MKIILTGPSVRNNGSYVDAGVEVEVGEAGEQISAERATVLVDDLGRTERAVLELDTPA